MTELINSTANIAKEEIAIKKNIFTLLSYYIPLCVEPEGITRVKEIFLNNDYLKAMSNLEKELKPKDYKKFRNLVDKDIEIQYLIETKSIEIIQELISYFIVLCY